MTQIKQLDWQIIQFNIGYAWGAIPIPNYLRYNIEVIKRATHEEYITYINDELHKKAINLEEAKHLAQSDFESKIKECLQ